MRPLVGSDALAGVLDFDEDERDLFLDLEEDRPRGILFCEKSTVTSFCESIDLYISKPIWPLSVTGVTHPPL